MAVGVLESMASFIRRRILTSETLGERLRKVREGRGLSLGEVETATSIRAGYLECLEDGDYSGLPGEVYVKSFLRVYGNFLGLGEEEVTQQYEKERKVDDYKSVSLHVPHGRDLFGNKARRGWLARLNELRVREKGKWSFGLGWRKTSKGKKNFLRNIVLSQIFIKAIVVLLILGVLFYLGWEVTSILSKPDLTVSTPADNLVIPEREIEVAGMVEGGAILKINGSEIVYDENGSFKERVDLKEGLNEIKVSAKKEHSRERVVWRRIVVE